MTKYTVEFILGTHQASLEAVRSSIQGLGEDLKVFQLPADGNDKGHNLKIHILTEDPTVIFDTCAGFGRIRTVKIT